MVPASNHKPLICPHNRIRGRAIRDGYYLLHTVVGNDYFRISRIGIRASVVGDKWILDDFLDPYLAAFGQGMGLMEIGMGCAVGNVVKDDPPSPEFLHHLAFQLFRKKDDTQIRQALFHLLKDPGRLALPESYVIFRNIQ